MREELARPGPPAPAAGRRTGASRAGTRRLRVPACRASSSIVPRNLDQLPAGVDRRPRGSRPAGPARGRRGHALALPALAEVELEQRAGIAGRDGAPGHPCGRWTWPSATYCAATAAPAAVIAKICPSVSSSLAAAERARPRRRDGGEDGDLRRVEAGAERLDQPRQLVGVGLVRLALRGPSARRRRTSRRSLTHGSAAICAARRAVPRRDLDDAAPLRPADLGHARDAERRRAAARSRASAARCRGCRG